MKKLLFSFFLFISSIGFAIDQLPYCYSSSAINYAKQFLPDNPVILECGGCEGSDTISMAMTWPKGMIYSFEPVPVLFDVLKNNTNAFPNVNVYQLALGDFCGKSIFHLSKRDGIQTWSSSLLPPSKHLELDPSTRFDDKIEVEVVTLDSWAALNGIDHIDYLWLDMQGYELNMLKASELAKKAKVIYMEVEFLHLYEGQYLYEDVLNWMSENGFELVAKDFYDYNLDFGNAVFINKKN